MQPISDTAAAAFAANPAPEQNLASAPTVDRPMPRLGRGIVWSDIVAEIERDLAARAEPPLPVPTTPIAMNVPVAREVLGPAEPRLEDLIAAALTGDVTDPPPTPSTPLEDVRAAVELVDNAPPRLTRDFTREFAIAEAVERTGWLTRAIARLRR